MKALLRILAALMGVFFLYATAVQYNDPDPIRWMLIYFSSAALCFLSAADRPPPWPVAGAVAAIALAWSAVLATKVLGLQPLFDEEGREMMGLAIAGTTTALLALQRRT